MLLHGGLARHLVHAQLSLPHHSDDMSDMPDTQNMPKHGYTALSVALSVAIDVLGASRHMFNSQFTGAECRHSVEIRVVT